MTELQRVIKYLAIALALFLAFSIIIGIVGLIGSIFFYDEGVLEEMREIEISQNIDRIHIEIGAAHLRVVEGDRFSLSTNLERLNVTSDDSRLIIQQKKRIVSVHSTELGEVILTIPEGTVFEAFELKAGAGEVEVQVLSSGILDLECGAGSVRVGKLVALKSAEIETGAGEMIISDGEIRDLDLDIGVGNVALRSRLTGECSINCGIGKADVTVLGNMNDYTLGIETGIGELILNGSEIRGSTSLGSGANELDIEGGIGTFSITFEK